MSMICYIEFLLKKARPTMVLVSRNANLDTLTKILNIFLNIIFYLETPLIISILKFMKPFTVKFFFLETVDFLYESLK